MNKVFKDSKGRTAVMEVYNKVIQTFSLDLLSEYIHTSRGKTHLLHYGDNSLPPLLLIHGTGSNAASFLYALEKLGERFHVILPDIPGEPGRSEDRRFPCRGKAFTEWITEIQDALAIEKINIGGQSLGAWASLRYAIDQPERVETALLISPSGLAPMKGRYIITLVFSLLRGEKGIRSLIGKMHNSNAGEIDELEIEVFSTLLKHTRFREDQPPLFTDKEIESIQTPLLYCGGMKDILLNTAKSASRLQKLNPGSKCIISSEGGHALNLWADDFLSFTL